MSGRRQRTRGLSRCGHRARTPEEAREGEELSQVEHLIALVRSAGITVALEDGKLVMALSPSCLGPGVGAAIATLTGRESLVRRVLERGAA